MTLFIVGDLNQGFEDKGENLNMKKTLKFMEMHAFSEEIALNREDHNVRG